MNSRDTFGPADVTCPYCGETIHIEAGPTKRVEVTHCDDRWIVVDLEAGKSGHTQRYATDGGTDIIERTLNPETHIAPDDYLSLIYEQDAAIHFYLKDDKEWWVAHGPADQPDGELDGPWCFWTTYPSGGWELDYFTEELAKHHIDELYYGPTDDRKHSIYRARLVPIEDAPRFVQEVIE